MTSPTSERGGFAPGLRWRLIVDPECGPDWNMAVDEAILDAVALGLSAPTVRLYRWDGPAVSVGRSQPTASVVNLPGCQSLGVPVVRRPTGGRAVVHGGDQCVSIVVGARGLARSGSAVVGSYRVLSSVIAAGLRDVGLEAGLARDSSAADSNAGCFACRSRSDLVAASGDKVAGSAQRRRKGTILQQSSVRHFEPPVEAAQVLLGPAEEGSYSLRNVDEDTLERALVGGLDRALDSVAPGCLSAWELERAAVLAPKCLLARVVDSAPSV